MPPESYSPVAPTRPSVRIHYLDWLRILALLGVFLIHVAHVFDTLDWHIKNSQQSDAVTALTLFLFPWGLGFFFMLAGCGAFFSLRSRSVKGYMVERVNRLLVPFAVAYVVLNPLQWFLQERSRGWTGSFMGAASDYLGATAHQVATWPSRPRTMLVGGPGGEIFHLWFLVYLLWFAMLGLPIFIALRSERGHRYISAVAERCSWRGSSLLFALPIAAAHVALRAPFFDERDWGEFAYYFAFFIVGYILVSDRRFLEAIERDLGPAVALGVTGFVVMMSLDPAGWVETWNDHPGYTPKYFLMITVFSLQAWGWAVAAFSWGMRVKRFQTPLPTAIGESAMPFFLFHQPVIIAVAYFVVSTSAGVALKMLSVLVGSFAISAALAYALTLSRATRRLMGVKDRAR